LRLGQLDIMISKIGQLMVEIPNQVLEEIHLFPIFIKKHTVITKAMSAIATIPSKTEVKPMNSLMKHLITI